MTCVAMVATPGVSGEGVRPDSVLLAELSLDAELALARTADWAAAAAGMVIRSSGTPSALAAICCIPIVAGSPLEHPGGAGPTNLPGWDSSAEAAFVLDPQHRDTRLVGNASMPVCTEYVTSPV